MTTQPIPYRYIESTDELQQAIDLCLVEPAVAIDTEFVRERTFFPEAGLIQLATDKKNWLIDPLAVDMSLFSPLLSNPNIVKILHSPSEDLELFDLLTHALPQPLFDTQVAAALVGFRFGIGYQAMIEDLLNVHIPKDQQRSNWCKRPLTKAQLDYAVLDVHWLIRAYDVLQKKLDEHNRMKWVLDNGTETINNFTGSVNSNYHLRFKNAWQLSPTEYGLLSELCQWRERRAATLNIPRKHVLGDDDLLSIIKRQPETNDDLRKVVNPSSQLNKKIESLSETLQQYYSQPVELESPEQFTGTLEKKQLKALKQSFSEVAEANNIQVELLGNKQKMMTMVTAFLKEDHQQLNELCSGWRRPFLLEALAKIGWEGALP